MMKKILLSAIVATIAYMDNCFALTIETVNLSQSSVPVWWKANAMWPITASADSYIKVLNIVNDYLWFALAAVSVWALIYVGIKLMSAQWDKAKMQQANRALVGMIIWLAIAYFSYTVVRMIANWF